MLRRVFSLMLLVLLFAYVLAIGGTYSGILQPSFRFQSVVLVGIVFVVWGVSRRGRALPPTALDMAMPLWALAFAVSLLANLDIWRRIAIGLWFVGLYVLVWYILSDVIAHRRLSRTTLVNVLLISGLIVLIFGYLQMQAWLGGALIALAAGQLPSAPPRPVSTLGNANALGALLAPLLPFIVGRMIAGRGAARWVMGAYALASALLLGLTFSRGAWIGAAVGVALQLALLLRARDMLSVSYWRGWWGRRGMIARVAATAAVLIVLAGMLAAALFFARTFSVGGRTLDLRTGIYDAAVQLFAEKPLTGHGLFTFGRGLSRFWSTPPQQVHSHAHDIPLHVAAELGVIGLVALAVSVFLALRAMRGNWLAASRERGEVAAAIAASVAFGVHHLTDIPAMMPAIALVGLLVMALAVAPNLTPQPPLHQNAKRVERGSRALKISLLTVLGGALIVSGVWGGAQYGRYNDALVYAASTGDYSGGAAQLGAVIEGDPALAIAYQQQGYLYGLAGETDAAIAAYERFTTLEPSYAIGWANLAALYADAGQVDAALNAMQRASDLAPESWQLAFRLGEYAETAGQMGTAEAVYRRALAAAPTVTLEAAQRQIVDDPLGADYATGANIAYIQYLHSAIPRQFLPQVGYDTAALALLRLIETRDE